MHGVKHLVQCHCILPQYKNKKDPVFHKFSVFSVIDKSDTVLVKFAECNCCSAVHKVYDICKSEIVVGRDEVKSSLKIEDFKYSMPSQLFELLLQYNKELPDFEQSQFIFDNELWDSTIVLSREDLGTHVQGKILRFVGKEKFRIESFTHKAEF